MLDESKFILLREELSGIIDKDKDSVRFYFLGNKWQRRVEQIGYNDSINVESALII